MVPGCDGAPLLPLLFIIVNIGFNIALLHLLKISSAVVSCLASTFSGMLIVSPSTTILNFILVKLLYVPRPTHVSGHLLES